MELRALQPWIVMKEVAGDVPRAARKVLRARARDLNSFVVNEMWLNYVSEEVMSQICVLDSVEGGFEGDKARVREVIRETLRSSAEKR